MKKWHSRHIGTIITACSLVLFSILRFPSLFEPHWYSDEGVYAAVAHAMESGRTLYTTVWDNKPPLIYFIYMIGNSGNRLLVIRIINFLAGCISIIGLARISQRFKISPMSLGVVVTVAAVLLGLPTLEGNIANGENLFLPFVIWGLYLGSGVSGLNLLISGLLFGLAFSIKFNPIFDAGVIIYILGLISLSHKKLKEAVYKIGTFIAGFSVPMVFLCMYLFYKHSIYEGINTIFLDNVRYAHVFDNPLLPQKVRYALLLVSLAIIGLLYFSKKLSQKGAFLAALFTCEFFGALLSGRRYTHYLLQTVPAIALISGYLATGKNMILKLGGFTICVLLSGYIFFQGDMRLPIILPGQYYSHFIGYISGSDSYFLFNDDQKLASIKNIRDTYYPHLKILIYTDNPWITDVLSIEPGTSFVTGYHQSLRQNGENIYLRELQKYDPDVIFFDESAATTPLVINYILQHYQVDRSSDGYLFFVKNLKNVASRLD